MILRPSGKKFFKPSDAKTVYCFKISSLTTIYTSTDSKIFIFITFISKDRIWIERKLCEARDNYLYSILYIQRGTFWAEIYAFY